MTRLFCTGKVSHLAKRKQKPTDPAEAARKAYETRRNPTMWGTNDAALSLPANKDVSQEQETRTKTRRVFRYDCFATVRLTPAQFSAVRRLQEDLAIRYRVEGSDRMSEHVDGSGSADLVTARSMDAGERLDLVLATMTPWHAKLLLALSIPAVVEGKQVNWKQTVRELLGTIDRNVQAHKVKVAAEGLRQAWADYDNQPVRRAA